MRDNTIKNYSVRSVRRRKAKNKGKAVKRTHAIRVACAVKPTDEMLAKRREAVAVHESALYRAREKSNLALRRIANDATRIADKAKVAKAMREFDASLREWSAYSAKKREKDALYAQKYMDDEYAYMNFPSN